MKFSVSKCQAHMGAPTPSSTGGSLTRYRGNLFMTLGRGQGGVQLGHRIKTQFYALLRRGTEHCSLPNTATRACRAPAVGRRSRSGTRPVAWPSFRSRCADLADSLLELVQLALLRFGAGLSAAHRRSPGVTLQGCRACPLWPAAALRLPAAGRLHRPAPFALSWFPSGPKHPGGAALTTARPSS